MVVRVVRVFEVLGFLGALGVLGATGSLGFLRFFGFLGFLGFFGFPSEVWRVVQILTQLFAMQEASPVFMASGVSPQAELRQRSIAFQAGASAGVLLAFPSEGHYWVQQLLGGLALRPEVEDCLGSRSVEPSWFHSGVTTARCIRCGQPHVPEARQLAFTEPEKLQDRDGFLPSTRTTGVDQGSTSPESWVAACRTTRWLDGFGFRVRLFDFFWGGGGGGRFGGLLGAFWGPF